MTRFQVRNKLLKDSTGKTFTGFSLRKKLFKIGFLATFTVVGAATFSTGQAQAALLGSGTLEISTGVGGFNIPFSNKFELTTRILSFEVPGLGFFPRDEDPVLFKGTIVTSDDVGRTFTATQSTDPEFNNFTSLLTNGKNNLIQIQYQEVNGFRGGGVGTNENYFTGDPTKIDFLGNTIDSISLKINSLEATRTISEDGFINSNFSANVTLNINGQPSSPKTVYEPASILGLLLVGTLSTTKMGKHKQKSASSFASIK